MIIKRMWFITMIYFSPLQPPAIINYSTVRANFRRVLPTTKKQDGLLFSYSTHAAYVPIGIFDKNGKKVTMQGKNALSRTIYYRKYDSVKEEMVHTDNHPKPSTGSLYW